MNLMSSNNTQQQSQSSKENQLIASNSTGSSKITKSTTKGLFKYLNVYRISSLTSANSQQNLIIQQYGQETSAAQNLSMAYSIKEKKQKSKLLF